MASKYQLFHTFFGHNLAIFANRVVFFFGNSGDYYLPIGHEKSWFWCFFGVILFLAEKWATVSPEGLWSQDPTKKLAHCVKFLGQPLSWKLVFKNFGPEPPPPKGTGGREGGIRCCFCQRRIAYTRCFLLDWQILFLAKVIVLSNLENANNCCTYSHELQSWFPENGHLLNFKIYLLHLFSNHS